MAFRHFCFTINNPGENALEFPGHVKYSSWQKEEGESGTVHYQGYVELDKPIKLGGIKKWGGDWARAHLEPRKGTREQAREYTRKEESRIDGPWEHGTWSEKAQGKRCDLEDIKERLWEGATVDEVAEEYPGSYIRYSNGIAKLAEVAQRRKRARIEAELREWQSDLIKYIEGEPDTRRIRWYIDAVGNVGKSWMCKYITCNYGGLPLTNAKHDRLLNAVQQARPRVVVFDFARDTISGDSDRVPYGPIEAIKNGLVFSGFFGAAPAVFPVPHVICFSNFEPDQTKFSADRWDIIYL